MNKEQYYQDLKAQKIAAGLNAEQAEEVTKRQREQDEANAVFGKVEKETVTPPAPKAPAETKAPAAPKAPAETKAPAAPKAPAETKAPAEKEPAK